MTEASDTTPHPWFTVRFARLSTRTAVDLSKRSLRCLRRNLIRITIWSVTLIVLAWQFENWHGRHELKVQRELLFEEYGEAELQDFGPPRVADDENFFAAPVFETFAAGPYENSPKIVKEMPHARFLKLQLPGIAEWLGDLDSIEPTPGVKQLDIETWAKSRRADGDESPPGMSDAQWLHASMLPDPTIDGLLDALSRPKSMQLPHVADLCAINEQSNDPYAAPIHSIGSVTNLAKNLATRARAAARAGDHKAASEHTEVILRLVEGFSSFETLVGFLVATAVVQFAHESLAECVASGCLTEGELEKLQARLAVIDIEKSAFVSMSMLAFGIHLWPVETVRDWHRQYFRQEENDPTHTPLYSTMFWFAVHGPDGWIDANLASHLRWWRMMLVPDSPGDDLLALHNKLDPGVEAVHTEMATPNPRNIIAMMAVPTLGSIVDHALMRQTRQRQVIYAIALERYRLAHGKLPETPDLLVPAFLDAIPTDPWDVGKPLPLLPGKEGERYRIISAAEFEPVLAMPELK